MKPQTTPVNIMGIVHAESLYRKFDNLAANGQLSSKLITKNGSLHMCQLLSDIHFLLDMLHDNLETKEFLESLQRDLIQLAMKEKKNE